MVVLGKKQIRKAITVVLLTVFIFGISIVEEKYKEKEGLSTNSEVLSSKKIEWGIKRNDNNEQPELGKMNLELIKNHNGIAMGDSNEKKIYLTFDEGYEAGYTSKILEILKNNDVKATFFITAHYLNTEPDLVKRMIDEGHIVGNHTVNHKSMPTLSKEEIKKEILDLHSEIYEKFQYEMKYLRPPKGEFSEVSLAETESLGYKTVMWSFAYEDWDENKQPDEEKAKEKIINNLHNGEIMLLHGNSKTNTNILDSIIKEIKNRSYEIKSLDEFQ